MVGYFLLMPSQLTRRKPRSEAPTTLSGAAVVNVIKSLGPTLTYQDISTYKADKTQRIISYGGEAVHTEGSYATMWKLVY